MADALGLTLGFPDFLLASLGFTNFTLSASNSQCEYIFQAKAADTITRLGVRLGTITGTTPTYSISLQGVDGSGNPDGTIKGGGSPASHAFSPSSLGWAAGSWNWLTLDNALAINRGDYLSVVVAYSSGTINASNCASFTSDMSSGLIGGFPYAIQNSAGTRTRRSNVPIFGYGGASTTYGYPCQTINTHTYNSGNSPNEYAFKFVLPSNWSQTARVRGVRLLAALPAANILTPTLYQGGNAVDTTSLQTDSHDTDYFQSAGNNRQIEIGFSNATLSTLNFGNTYRIGFVPGASSMSLFSLDVAAASDWDAWAMGENMSFSTRNGSGNWTDTATRRLLASVVLDDLTQNMYPLGGMHGGFRG